MAPLLLVLLSIINLQFKMLSIAAQSEKDFGYLNFVYNATDQALAEAEYDYIIVGGGTAGCPLAATLSINYSVLLLERGGIPQLNPDVLHWEGFLSNLIPKDDMNSPVEEFISEDGVPNARGRVLGGSSMINGGFYSRAEEEFYAESGIDWEVGVVKKAYEWVEETVVSNPKLRVWQSAIRDGLLESGVGPDNGFSLNHIEGTKVSGTTFDASGRRHGAVELLNRGVEKNLRVAVHAIVERVIFSTSKSSGLFATGVIYRDSNGKTHQALIRDKGEVILSAGAIGSPQLLLLSGVGPQHDLLALQIPVVYHQPNVGQFVCDNPRNGIAIVPPFSLESSFIQVVGITKEGSNIEPISYTKMPFLSPVRFGLFPNPSAPTLFDVASIFEKIARPLSNGSLRLASPTDVRVTPSVRYNYFANPIDLEKCVSAMKNIEKLLSTRSLDQFKYKDLKGIRDFRFMGLPLPKNQSDDTAMEAFCKKTVTTIWHYHGGCTVGKVVDNNFKVMGISALRVVDGSIFTMSPGTNPQATIMMLGRYSGLKILEERGASN